MTRSKFRSLQAVMLTSMLGLGTSSLALAQEAAEEEAHWYDDLSIGAFVDGKRALTSEERLQFVYSAAVTDPERNETFTLASAQGDGPDAALGEKGRVDPLALLEAPGPGPHPGGGAEGGPGQEAAVGGLHPHGLAGVAAALGDGGIEDPGVAPQQRALAAFA